MQSIKGPRRTEWGRGEKLTALLLSSTIARLALVFLDLKLLDLEWNLHPQLSDSEIIQVHSWLSWVSSLDMADTGTSQSP